MEGNEEEDFDDHFLGNAGFGAFDDDIPMEEPEADVAEDDPGYDLGQALHNVLADCESEKGEVEVPEDVRGPLEVVVPRLRRWIEEAWHHPGVAAMEDDK